MATTDSAPAAPSIDNPQPYFTRTLLTSHPVLDDRQVHAARLETIEGKVFYEVREYVPSLGAYGRGITVPASSAQVLIDAVTAIAKDAR